ncbi:pentatricopeptide repeat-containing protein At5g16860-like [Selaginella moellendorffii]|uniref:pentatricopeptide repeat-containing protein At5g16860-like n=1 Tax=Selaginella moellendorffii TaxID=88036 RepID=UPI000D1C8414|nr:pentatricopeptide repeat-containing protein At5g16860-like [Selaginella moellendorffii]|eukprot:XP_024540452.1 pentatricopeptide repeat-containing protein At5g16860-like [Selaginella moellendorffii]
MVNVFLLHRGMEVHRQAEAGMGIDAIHRNVYVGNALIDMYVKCRSMVRAQEVFDRMKTRDVVSWNQSRSQGRSSESTREAQVSSNGCGDLWHLPAAGKCVPEENISIFHFVEDTQGIRGAPALSIHFHDEIREESVTIRAASPPRRQEQCRVFDRVKHRDVVIWNTVISGYTQNDESEAALELFEALLCDGGISPTSLTVVAAFKACGSLAVKNKERDRTRALEITIVVHREAVTKLDASEWDAYMTRSVIDAYARCGRLGNTGQLRNVVSWNVLILGFAENGDARRRSQVVPQDETRRLPTKRINVRRGAESLQHSSLELGSNVKALIYRGGIEEDGVLAGTLVDFHGKAGDMVSARQLFDSLAGDGDEAWSALIAGYSRQGDASQAPTLFYEMVNSGIKPHGITALAVLTTVVSSRQGRSSSKKCHPNTALSPKWSSSTALSIFSAEQTSGKKRSRWFKVMTKRWNFEPKTACGA